jgi:hypothetical protein
VNLAEKAKSKIDRTEIESVNITRKSIKGFFMRRTKDGRDTAYGFRWWILYRDGSIFFWEPWFSTNDSGCSTHTWKSWEDMKNDINLLPSVDFAEPLEKFAPEAVPDIKDATAADFEGATMENPNLSEATKEKLRIDFSDLALSAADIAKAKKEN